MNNEQALTLDEAILKRWVGKSQVIEDTISASTGRQMASLLGEPFDASRPLPALWHWLYFQEPIATEALDEDGHERLGGFLPPVNLPRRMWAGGRLRFHEPIYFGDSLEKHSEVMGVEVKQGRSGQLCFVTIEHTVLKTGKPVLVEEHDIVYLQASESVDAQSAEPGLAAAKLIESVSANSVRITPSVTALFRYSALTYNAHRIHYDRAYCVDKEHYKGLVFHGPLTATLMARLACAFTNRPLRSFEFRALSPVFDTDRFVINCDMTADNECEVVASLPDGAEVMRSVACV